MSGRLKEFVSAVVGLVLTLAFVGGGLWVYQNGWAAAAARLGAAKERLLSSGRPAPPRPAPPARPESEAEEAPQPPAANAGPVEVEEAPGDLEVPSFPESTVFRFTDDGGNLRFVTGLSNVPLRYRDRMSVVDGSRLSTYKSSRPAPDVRATTAPAPDRSGPGPGGEWNEAQIEWVPFAGRVNAARRLGKPVLLVVHTSWCGVCRKYKKVFRDPEVVALSKRFVMVQVDSDGAPEAGELYAPDGHYIPRTMFLDKTGRLVPDLVAKKNARHRYVYSASDPNSLIQGMRRALERLQ